TNSEGYAAMNIAPVTLRRRAAEIGLAVLAAMAGGAGAARPPAADAHPTALQTGTSPITHAVAGARASDADVVKLGAPAVVTVRANGRARVPPTDFQFPNDDLLRRFFGDQFDRGQQQQRPRTFRQSALGSGVIITSDGYI